MTLISITFRGDVYEFSVDGTLIKRIYLYPGGSGQRIEVEPEKFLSLPEKVRDEVVDKVRKLNKLN